MDPVPFSRRPILPPCQPPIEPEYAAGLLFLAFTGAFTVLSIIIWSCNNG